MKKLDLEGVGRVAAAAQSIAAARGPAYYGWVEAPEAKADGTLTHKSG